MAIVKKKSRLHHQISFDPFLLFVISSVAIHGLIALGLVWDKRSPQSELEEATPIDFVVLPPEESPAEPPPDTELLADENSVAQGDVKPELPTASNRIDSKKAVATPANPAAEPPPVTPTPQPQAEAPPPVTPPSPPEEAKAIATPATPPKEIEPNPPVETIPRESQPSPEPTESANDAPPLPKEPKPVANKPLLSGSDTSSLPEETPVTAENPFKTDLPPKPRITEPLPELEKTPPTETENSSESDLTPVATNSPPKPKPIEPPPTPTPPVPETPTSESQTAVGRSAASLLEGTESRSSEDSESTFFAPEANASEQAVNSSGVDARAKNVDLGPYLAEVKQRVRQNWQTPTVDDNRQTVIIFAIERNGQIRGLQIKQSSGSPEVDNKFLAAIEKAAPFAPLPANYPNSHLNIVYDLNINMYVR